jgi:hypothetical protein
MFIAVLTRARHCFLSWARWNQSKTSHPVSLASILILSSHLRLYFPCGLFPSAFSIKILYEFLISYTRATYPTHLILRDFIIAQITQEQAVFK